MKLTKKERQIASRSKLRKGTPYTVYLIKTRTSDYYYVGWASNWQERWRQHRAGIGAKFTKEYGVDECSVLCKVNSMNEAEWREKLYTILLKRENPSWVVSMGMPLSLAQITRTLNHFGRTEL